MLYSSVENNKIKDLKKLQSKKYRDKKNKFLVEGRHLVLEAFKTGYLEELLLEENELLPLDVMTNYMTNNVSNYLSELETTTNIIGVCNKKEGTLKGNKIVLYNITNMDFMQEVKLIARYDAVFKNYE